MTAREASAVASVLPSCLNQSKKNAIRFNLKERLKERLTMGAHSVAHQGGIVRVGRRACIGHHERVRTEHVAGVSLEDTLV